MMTKKRKKGDNWAKTEREPERERESERSSAFLFLYSVRFIFPLFFFLFASHMYVMLSHRKDIGAAPPFYPRKDIHFRDLVLFSNDFLVGFAFYLEFFFSCVGCSLSLLLTLCCCVCLFNRSLVRSLLLYSTFFYFAFTADVYRTRISIWLVWCD